MVGIALAHLVPGLLLLGFAYLILTVANKELGTLKLVGQVIGWGLVVVIILAGLSCGLKKNCPICHKSKMMNPPCEMNHPCPMNQASPDMPKVEKK